MRLDVTPTYVDFLAGNRQAGRYVYDDPYKPHLHPLSTPAGHPLSLVSPHDHKHHKGLMYALRTRQVNFWEEYVTRAGEAVGRQRHEAFEAVEEEGERVGFAERLTWLAEDDSRVTFDERRTLHCRSLGSADSAAGDGKPPEAFEWTWRTRLVARRAMELVKSQFSVPNAAGDPINYHGLGLRLRRDFGCTGGNRFLVDGHERSFSDGLGAVARSVAFEGSLDGTVPVEGAGVRIEQEQEHGLFVLETPFAFLSLGPSNLEAVSLEAGDRLVETYTVTAYDCAAPPRKRSA